MHHRSDAGVAVLEKIVETPASVAMQARFMTSAVFMHLCNATRDLRLSTYLHGMAW